MDKMLLDTKHITIYLSTLQIGIGVAYIPEHKELSIMIGIIEINLRRTNL